MGVVNESPGCTTHAFLIIQRFAFTRWRSPRQRRVRARTLEPVRRKCDAMTLTSNEKRAQRRQECREALVAHICKEHRPGIIEGARR